MSILTPLFTGAGGGGGGGGGAFTADGNGLISATSAPVLDEATGNEVAYTFPYTVNKSSSGNDTGLLINQTDTLSPGTSLLADFQVGGASKCSVNNAGRVDGVQFNASSSFTTSGNNGPQMLNETPSGTNPVFTFGFDGDTGMSRAGADQLSLIAGGVEALRLTEAAGLVSIQSSVADGASAVAFDFDTTAAYSTSGAKLASFKNNAVEKAWIDKDGNLGLSASGAKFYPDGDYTQTYVGNSGVSLELVGAAQYLYIGSGGAGSFFLIPNSNTIQMKRHVDGSIYVAQSSTDSAVGTLSLTGGAAGSASTSNLDGGALNLTGGAGASSSAGDADGGAVNLTGGAGYGTGDGGSLVLAGGAANGTGVKGSISIDSYNTTVKLGDAAGANKLSVQDSGGVEVAYIDSDGEGVFGVGSDWQIKFDTSTQYEPKITTVGSSSNLHLGTAGPGGRVVIDTTSTSVFNTGLVLGRGGILFDKNALQTFTEVLIGYNGIYAVDQAAVSLKIAAQEAYASATVNQDGGHLKLRGGDSATGGGTKGSVQFLDPADDSVQLSVNGDGVMYGHDADGASAVAHTLDTASSYVTAGAKLISVRNNTAEKFGIGYNGDFTGILLRGDQTNGNYAFGLNALDSLTLGSGLKNVAIGEDAGTAETTGDENTFIGHNAGKAQNGRSKSTFIGAFAGAGTSIGGFNNTAVGHGSMQSISTGASNTSVGMDTLKNVGNGGSNCAFGYQSGDSCTGSNNAFFGASSGGAVGAGSGNTLIGTFAGSNLTTGASCVVLGAYLTQLASATADYQIRIGSGASGVPVIDGFMGANTDVDHSGNTLTVSGSSAFPLASTNLSAGDLILQGGVAATTGAGVGGDIFIRGGSKGSTGTDGNVYLCDSNTAGLSFWNATPVAQQSGTGETTGFTAGAGTAVNDDSTFTGNVGATAYRINDIVKALKQYGLLAQ